MKISSLNELIKKNNEFQKKSTSSAEREVFFETALKFIKKNFNKEIYNRCNLHIYPGVSIGMSSEERENDDKEKMVWICKYLETHQKN